jgi:two-component system, chemotaxis family, sensor kinase CheA
MAVQLDTLARLEEFPTSQVERSGTRWVAQNRGQILPLVNVAFVLEERRTRRRHRRFTAEGSENVRLEVLVCNYKGQRVGVVVERIVDIVEDAAEVR